MEQPQQQRLDEETDEQQLHQKKQQPENGLKNQCYFYCSWRTFQSCSNNCKEKESVF